LRNPRLVKNGANISGNLREFVRFIAAGVTNSPQKRSLRLKWYQTVRVTEEV